MIKRIDSIGRKGHHLELSLVALNFALQHNLVYVEVFDRLFLSLVAVVRDFVESYKDAPRDDEAMPFHLVLVIALRIAQTVRVPFANKGDSVLVIKELIQFHCKTSSALPRVKEDILRLAICLVNQLKGLELEIDSFLANWSLRTLSSFQDEHSTSLLCLALGSGDGVFNSYCQQYQQTSTTKK